uniref:Zinc knuckle CX2CX4HX4C domain-containing protein n=1 Tax=Cannabis sativa TaxID=3483 RepID=A0A803PAG1_CANSA
MKTLERGTWGFFFDLLEDKEEVLKHRPWIIARQLLNIKEWPLDGAWFGVLMNKAAFWVEIHGLPTPYLAFQNYEFLESNGVDNRTIARWGFLKLEVDIFIDQWILTGFYLSITRGRKEWIQFKYRKLSKICFKCGYLAHGSNVCSRNHAYAYPLIGNAVPLYGPWIKAIVPIRSCFDTKGPSLLRDRVDRTVNIQGTSNIQVNGTVSLETQGTGTCIEATTLNTKVVHTTDTNDFAEGISKFCSVGMTTGVPLGIPKLCEKEHLMNRLGKNPADENVIVCMMAHVGPDVAQAIERPHHKVLPSTSGSKTKKRKATRSVSPIVTLVHDHSLSSPNSKVLAPSLGKSEIAPFSFGKESPKKESFGSRKLRSRKSANDKSKIVTVKANYDNGNTDSGTNSTISSSEFGNLLVEVIVDQNFQMDEEAALSKPPSPNEAWFDDSSSWDVIKEAWTRSALSEEPWCLGKIINYTQHALRWWSKNLYGECDNRIKELELELQTLQSKEVHDVNELAEATILQIKDWVKSRTERSLCGNNSRGSCGSYKVTGTLRSFTPPPW